MFKVGDELVAISSELHGGIRIVQELVGEIWLVFEHHGFHKSLFRHATPEEITAGHRIDKTPLMQHLDKCEEVVKTWPKWKQQSIRETFGIPNLETLRDCDTSPNCKKFDEQVK